MKKFVVLFMIFDVSSFSQVEPDELRSCHAEFIEAKSWEGALQQAYEYSRKHSDEGRRVQLVQITIGA